MDLLTRYVADYGPVLVFLGTFFEGETMVIVAGFLSHQRIIDPYYVAVCAFAGSCLGDQFWFYLARRHSDYPLIARMTRRPLYAKTIAAIQKHPRKFILTFRFIYGIRILGAIAVGLSEVRAGTFYALNATAAAVWATTFTVLGYFFGQAFEQIYGNIEAVEQKLLVAGIVLVAVFVIGRGVIAARRRKRNGESTAG